MAAALPPPARASKRLIHAAFSYPIMGRLRADPGEKHEPRVTISSLAEYLDLASIALCAASHLYYRRALRDGEWSASIDTSRDREAAVQRLTRAWPLRPTRRLSVERFKAIESWEARMSERPESEGTKSLLSRYLRVDMNTPFNSMRVLAGSNAPDNCHARPLILPRK